MRSLTTTSECLERFGIRCYRPAQLHAAYGVDQLHTSGIDGRGRTIVIVEPFGSPTIRADLRTFNRVFGLPDPPTFSIIEPAGPVPPFDPADPEMLSWAQETKLDVQWAHAMAQGADILLVRTPVSETRACRASLRSSGRRTT